MKTLSVTSMCHKHCYSVMPLLTGLAHPTYLVPRTSYPVFRLTAETPSRRIVHCSLFIVHCSLLIDYSYLSASTGFRVAARQLCQLTLSSATSSDSSPARTNTHQLSVVL